MILSLQSPAAPSLQALLAPVLAAALSYSGIRNAFLGKMGGPAWIPDVNCVPQPAGNIRQ
jgi:hypothetical protein